MTCPSCGHENTEGTDRCDECMTPLQKLDVPGSDTPRNLAHSVMSDNLGQLEAEETLTVTPDTPALEVARRMKAARSGCALVLDESGLAGIFTEHDVLYRMFEPDAGGKDLAVKDLAVKDLAVKDLMTASPESLRESDSVATALNKMSLGRYRHIPVVKADGSYTVTSIKSVLKYIAKEDW